MASAILLWAFVLNLGVVLGAGLYEARISVPRWIVPPGRADAGWRPEEAARDDTGRRFWVFTTTVPLTLLTVANLAWAWSAPPSLRAWWVAAGLAALADRVLTFGYFIPRMVRLMREKDSAEARSRMGQWGRLNYVRLAIVLIAWVAALQAFARLQRG